MEANDVRALLFCGAGEVAELAYLYLQFSKIKLVGIIDEQESGKLFFGQRIAGFGRLEAKDWDMILLTRLDEMDGDIKHLMENWVNRDRIATI